MNAKLSARSQLWLLWPLVLGLMAWAHVSRAQITPPFTTLYTFSATSSDANTDGANPYAGLIHAKDGFLYGTTYNGGVNGNGTVFKITTAGTLTSLYSFSPDSSSYPYGNLDGAHPMAGLIQGTDGALYGTAYLEGANGDGTVFKITTAGALTPVHSFNYNYSDGAFPEDGVIQGKDGNLYGTTTLGGANIYGTVFKLTTTGTLTTLGSFSGSNGESPNGLIQGKDGNLYGTTIGGGATPYPGDGVAFRITAADALGIVSFSNGESPNGLIQATDGHLYGTTELGGANGDGTVFKMTTSGTLTTLHDFTRTDGGTPMVGLIQGKDNALYGTTYWGGANDAGTVFRITTAGALTTLYSFITNDSPNGLLQGKDGNLYGTTSKGGANGDGTVFKLTMTPVISSISPMNGPDGTSVTVTGVNFTETTSVKVGGASARFTIQSDTSLTLVVPAGPKSGKITVVNPFGQGVSSAVFTVAPIVTGFSPASGPVGASVTVTGVNFTGAKSVTLGALSASFAINSDTSLTFVVPAGAKSAKITVVNPFGAGTSAATFKVTN